MSGLIATIAAEIAKPNHASEWISGLTGAGGAILGSLVTVAWTEFFNRRTRSRNDRERRATGGFAAYQKLNQIYSVSTIIRNHFREGISARRDSGEPLSSRVQPMNRLSDPVNFTIDELWVILKIGKVDFLNKVNSLDQVFNSILIVVEDYRKQRDALFEEAQAGFHGWNSRNA